MQRKQVRWLSEWLRAGKPAWQDRFARLGNDQKHTCLICGATGWTGINTPELWQINCLLGHNPCFRCGIPVHRQPPECRHTKYHSMRRKSLNSDTLAQ